MLPEGGELNRTIIWILSLGIFFFIFPKMYFFMLMREFEVTTRKLEEMVKEAREIAVKLAEREGGIREKAEEIVKKFSDFFMIQPIDLDPYGIVYKLEHVLESGEERFREVAREIAPKANKEVLSNVMMTLKGVIALNSIAKIVRHNVELVRKTGNFQIALILKMVLPLIVKIAEGQLKGTKAFSEGKPIGDGVGPLVVASMIDGDPIEEEEEIIYKKNIDGREVFLIKPKGPGGRLGKLDKAIYKIIEKEGKISRIITVDAALKLEGEETGSVNEGVGVAMGGPGVQRWKIEKLAAEMGIPIDAIAIKMSEKEAISPMKKKIFDSIEEARESILRAIKRAPLGSRVIVVGVGNTCGIGNNKDYIKKIEDEIKEEEKKKSKEKGK